MARHYTFSLLLLLATVERQNLMILAQHLSNGTTTNTSVEVPNTTVPSLPYITTAQTPNNSGHAVRENNTDHATNATTMKESNISSYLNNSIPGSVEVNKTSMNATHMEKFLNKNTLADVEGERTKQSNLETYGEKEDNQTKMLNTTYQKLERIGGPNETWRDVMRTFQTLADDNSTNMADANYSLEEELLTTVDPVEQDEDILRPTLHRIVCEFDFEIGCFRSIDLYNGSVVDLAGIVVLIRNVTTSLATIDWYDFNISQPFPETFYVYVESAKFSTEVSLTARSGVYVFTGLFSGETYDACVVSERWVQRNKDCTPCCGQFHTEGKDDHVYAWPLINRLAIVITAFLFIIVMWGVGTAWYSNDYTLLVEESDFAQNGY